MKIFVAQNLHCVINQFYNLVNTKKYGNFF